MQPFRYNHLLSAQGVRAITVDADGFLWVGTYDGLNRFDGNSILQFNRDPDRADSLDSDNVLGLFLDSEKHLWALTEYALNRYNPRDQSFQRIFGGVAEKKDWIHLTCGLADQYGQIWVGTDQGLFRLNAEQNQLVHANLTQESVLCLRASSNGTVWLGTQQALYRFDSVALHLEEIPFSRGYAIQNVLLTDKGLLLVATGQGLLVYPDLDQAPKRFQHIAGDSTSLSHNNLLTLNQTQEGDIWVGSKSGLNRFDPVTESFEAFYSGKIFNSGLSNDAINTLFQNQPGLLWIGTDVGLCQLDTVTRKFKTVRFPNPDGTPAQENFLRGLFEDHASRVWIGHKEGLVIWDRQNRTFKHMADRDSRPNGLPVGTIWSLMQDGQGDLWLASDSGLARWIPQTEDFEVWTHQPDDPHSLPSNALYCLAEWKPGWIVIGTRNQGMALFEKQTGKFTHFEANPDDPDGLPDVYVRCFLRDSLGRFWVGTHRGFLLQFFPESGRFQRFSSETNPLHSFGTVYFIQEGADGSLWLGRGEGLQHAQIEADRMSLRTYTVRDGLPNNSVFTVLLTGDGGVWFSTNSGLGRLNPQTGSISCFGIEDGLQASEFNLNSALKLNSGKLIFGGVNGLNEVDPEHIPSNPFVPPIGFVELQVNNRPVQLNAEMKPVEVGLGQELRPGDLIQLAYNEKSISIRYAGLNFAGPERNQYRYRLEGFNDEWIHAGQSQTATYTNLSPGRYTFWVQAANNDGLWNPQPVSLGIQMVPAYWQTFGFKLLLVLLLASVLFMVHKYRTGMLKQHAEVLLNEIQSRKDAENRFSLAFQSSPDGIIMVHCASGEILDVNWGFCHLCRLDDHFLKQSDFFELALFPKLEQQVQLRTQIENQQSFKNWNATLMDREGNPKIVQISAETIQFKAEPCMLMMVRDLTETSKLEAQLNHTQKMESIGQLAGGIAHDFNNLLTVISGYAELAEKVGGDDPKRHQFIEGIQNAAHKAQRLTSQILAFSRKQVSNPVPLEIHSVLPDLIHLIRRILDDDIQLDLVFSDEPIVIRADPSQLEQIVMNMLVNARDAIRMRTHHGHVQENASGRIIISTSKRFVDPHSHILEPGLGSGWYLALSLEDNGCGMSEEVRNRVFEPFYTTKPQGSGTGLGLATVYGIIKQNHGNVYLYSEPGIGTRFTIYWPMSENQEVFEAKRPQDQPVVGGDETLLIVEDNPSVLEYLESTLSQLGYQLQSAPHGLAALEKIEAGFQPDLIISDLIMPEMNGSELLERLKDTVCSGTPVLLLSGYSGNLSKPSANGNAPVAFLQKPFSLIVLAQTIRRLLGSGSSSGRSE
ncbi:MAG: response regulator [Acidobacteria bacterium]|nr:response regulator [Acidobacteriota bacterium]